jgi:Tfp pilus assembly protein FimV
MAQRPFRSLTSLLLACALLGGAHAAELGDARVTSHIGQQLVADIELTALESPGAPVQVRLAHPDVYRGANIAMPPVLSSLHMSVTQRDGRQFLHLTSLKPVDADHLHLYLELVDGGNHAVRLSTLWLSPDPNPAPVAPPLAWERETPAPAAPAAQPVPTARVASPVRAASERVVQPPVHVAPPVRIRLPLPAPAFHLPVARTGAPAACAPKPSQEASACVALDAKNVALRAKLEQLEHTVKVLQGSLQATPAPVASQPVKLAEVPAGPRPIKPRKPRKQAEPQESGLPWLAVGLGATALLALLGGIGWFVWRRRVQAQWPKPTAAVSREGIKSRLMGGP